MFQEAVLKRGNGGGYRDGNRNRSRDGRGGDGRNRDRNRDGRNRDGNRDRNRDGNRDRNRDGGSRGRRGEGQGRPGSSNGRMKENIIAVHKLNKKNALCGHSLYFYNCAYYIIVMIEKGLLYACKAWLRCDECAFEECISISNDDVCTVSEIR